MKYLILALTILATPALADTAPPGQRAVELLLERERFAHQNDVGAALQLQDQVAALTKQVADLTAENAKLKPTPAP